MQLKTKGCIEAKNFLSLIVKALATKYDYAIFHKLYSLFIFLHPLLNKHK